MSKAYLAGVTKVGIAVEIDSSKTTMPIKLETAK